jgi:orotate phosphoribosyltransferase
MKDPKIIKHWFIAHLIDSGAVKFGTFTLKSGRVAPYFVNMAVAMNKGKGFETVVRAYGDTLNNLGTLIYREVAGGVEQNRPHDEKAGMAAVPSYIHGPAYKGIALAAGVAAGYCWADARWGYDRKEEKKHGDVSESRIVGDIQPNDRIVIVDDVLTTGQTKIDARDMLLEECRRKGIEGVKVTIILVGVDRQETDLEIFEKEDIRFESVVTISEILDYLDGRDAEKHYGITKEQIVAVRQYVNERRNGT